MATAGGREWIADYQVIRPLGPAGPDSQTFLASPPRRLQGVADQVALHLLDPDVERFNRTVDHLRNVAAARSTWIVNLIEAGRDERGEPIAYYATPFQSQGSLADNPPTGVRARLRVLAQAARGVHDLHQSGHVYGALDLAVRLLGADRAVLSVPPSPTPLEVGETVMASPADQLETVDPAVIRGEGRSRATDLWALGATIHIVLAQRSLHPGLTNDDPLTAVQRVLFEPPSVDLRLPPEHAAVIDHCLAPNPDDRPASALDLAQSLDELAAAQ